MRCFGRRWCVVSIACTAFTLNCALDHLFHPNSCINTCRKHRNQNETNFPENLKFFDFNWFFNNVFHLIFVININDWFPPVNWRPKNHKYRILRDFNIFWVSMYFQVILRILICFQIVQLKRDCLGILVNIKFLSYQCLRLHLYTLQSTEIFFKIL